MGNRLLRISHVTQQTGLSRSHIYKLMSEGKFPENVILGPRCVAWVEQEVDEWIQNKISERDSIKP